MSLLNRSTWWKALPLFLWLPTLLGGCAGPMLPHAQEDKTHSYLLEWDAALGGNRLRSDGPSLLVSAMRSAPGFESAEMAYVRSTHQLEYFAWHRWVDAPAHMLDPMLLQAAAGAGLFKSVSEAGSGTQAQLRLDSRLLHLRQVYTSEPAELQLAVRLALVDVPSARQVGSQVVSVDEPLQASTPAAGVAAANRAVARLLTQVEGFLAEHAGRYRQ